MDFAEYSEKAHSTALYQDSPILKDAHPAIVFEYPSLGLVGEAGEVAEKAKKLLRGDAKYDIDDPAFREMMKKELGDVLWYLNECALRLGWSLEDIATGNIDKLFSRRDRGMLKGDGDDR